MPLTTERTIGFHCEQTSLGYLRQKCIFPFSRPHGLEIAVLLGGTITLHVWLLGSQLTGSHYHGCSHLPGGGQSKVRRVAGLQDGDGAHQHSYIVSHMSPSQAEHLSCVKAQRRQGLAPEHTPSPVGDGPLKQTAAPLCHVYGSEVCSLLASGKSRIQLDTKICF